MDVLAQAPASSSKLVDATTALGTLRLMGSPPGRRKCRLSDGRAPLQPPASIAAPGGGPSRPLRAPPEEHPGRRFALRACRGVRTVITFDEVDLQAAPPSRAPVRASGLRALRSARAVERPE